MAECLDQPARRDVRSVEDFVDGADRALRHAGGVERGGEVVAAARDAMAAVSRAITSSRRRTRPLLLCSSASLPQASSPSAWQSGSQCWSLAVMCR